MLANNRTSPIIDPDPPSPAYHATEATLEPGDFLLPGREVGASRGQYVWFDSQPGQTWGPNMYEVEPIGTVEAARGYWRARSARVIRRIEPSPPCAVHTPAGAHHPLTEAEPC